MRTQNDRPFLGGLVPVNDILNKTARQFHSNLPTHRKQLNPLKYAGDNRFSANSN